MNKLLKIAFTQYGIREISGEVSNIEVNKYFDALGLNYDDNYAWCSAFLNWCCMEAGLNYSGKLNARSWLEVGEEVAEPELGDIVIFWRESEDSWKGHVAIYINDDGNHIYVLGGNQNNMVCIKSYPSYRLLGFRRLNA